MRLIFLYPRLHQRQLLEETRGGCPSPPRPTQLDVKSHSPSHAAQLEEARDVKKMSPPASAAVPAVQETGMEGDGALSIVYLFLIVSLYN